METKNIAVACFIGGVLFCAVALMFAPAYWWLGLISGIAAGVTSGYISYDFHEVRKAIPIAMRAAGKGVAIALTAVIDAVVDVAREIKEWFKKPHPLVYSSLAITAVYIVLLEFFYLHVMAEIVDSNGEKWGISYSHLFILLTSVLLLEMFGFFLLPLFVSIGTRSEHCYWETNPYAGLCNGMGKSRNDNDKMAPLTYANVARWFAKGLGIVVLFFIWTMWKHVVIGAWATLCFLGLFAWHLFKLIHSEKRVLCALDGTLGGVASYIWLASSATSFAEQTTLVIFGGLLGAAFGVANWEIVSKRILHVHASVNNASA